MFACGDRFQQVVIGVRCPVCALYGSPGDAVRSWATAASIVQWTTRICARSVSGSRFGRHSLSWNAASTTTVTPDRSSTPQDVEERGERPPVEGIVRKRLELGSGVDHPLLDLVTADRGAAERPRHLVRQRGLARTRRPAHDGKYRNCH